MSTKEPGIDIILDNNITCGILSTIVPAIGSLRMRRITKDNSTKLKDLH